ncbi:WD40 repeat protein [Kibdelosporangium banguiense]|uniref:WD40 repeat protein n=1 Tax=Kibdelosporangium banguiense TaxID=1365924 RepID=A0ABS4TSS4_9PSEU|nr:helix-turn-helix domain-containing protein [Kibdelosporangium banguiense]MBP2327453.1 WD40 repeat protein [Kibdelosporangium banguiense]
MRVPRPERPLDPAAGPVAAFAAELRELRARAGGPGYRELAERAGYSAATLSNAAGGRRLPSLVVTLAFVRACDGDPGEWERRWRRVAGESSATPVAPVEGDHVTPYLGLAPYGVDDAERFFGRRRMTARLVNLLDWRRFVAVFGVSGSGKSSLLRAGLVPALCERGRHTVVITPGARPATALREVPADDDVLVVDQFEELFTLCPDALEKSEFVDALAARVARPGSATVIGVRADFYARCIQLPRLASLLAEASVPVDPLAEDDVREVITKPAHLVGVTVERALVTKVLAEVAGQPGALPLVSHALLETWRQRRSDMLTVAGYEAAGGVASAVARTAEAVYQRFTADHADTAREVLVRLVVLGEGGMSDTRRRVTRDELDFPGVDVVLRELAAARLVVLGQDTVEIAHEALIGAWPRLRDWLHQDRETLRLHRQLTHDSETWCAHDRDPDLLYRGVRLAAWDGRGMARLNERERAFLAESRQRVAREARLRRRRLRLAVTALATGLVVTTVLALVAVAQANRARDERDGALARQLVANARDQLQIDQELAVLLAREAYDTKPTDETAAVLRQAVADSRVRAVHSSGQAQVFGVAYSPDGRQLASSGADGTIRVWRLEGPDRFGEEPQVLRGHTGIVWSPVFSRDGRWLAAGGNDDAVTVWDLVGGGAPIVLRGHGGGVSGVAVSPSGERVAAAGDDGLIHLWDRVDPQRPVSLPLGGGAALAVAFSADGTHLAAGGASREVRVWRGDGAGTPVVLRGHEGEIEQITFSPDGKRLASGSHDTTMRIWNTSGEGEPLVLRADDGTVETVAFSPDGRRIASGHSGSDTVRVWNTTAGELPNPLEFHGHDGPVWSVAFSPDGQRVASGSGDGTIRLWDPAYPGTPQVMYGHDGPAYSVAVSRDGRTIASSGLDGTVRLWRAPHRRDPLVLPGHDGSVRLVAVSADGRWVASAGKDRTVRIWDAVEGKAVAVLDHDQPVRSVAFSPDGRRVASGGSDGAVTIWPADGRGAPSKLQGHDHSEVWSVAFSLDGQSVASTGQDSTVRFQRIDGSGTPRVIHGGPGLVWCVAFTPDGQHLLTCGDDGSIRIWRGDGQGQPRILRGHRGPVWAMAISPDGRRMATAGNDGTLRIWTLPDGKELVALRGHGASVEQVAFQPDSAGLFTAHGDGTARFVRCEVCGPIDEVRTMADSRVTRSLTAEERETYLGEAS